MKVLIVGAGAQGGPCASILARDKDVSKIVLGDINLGLADKVKNKVKSDKITAVKLDAGKIEDVERAAQGVDVVINLTLVRFNAKIMKAAVNSGAHYVDAALDYPLWAQLTENQPLELDDEFKKAGLTALVACGGSPGITNVLARYACDKLDRVDEIKVRLGGKLLEKPKEVVSAWTPGWCPEIALTDYADATPVFEDGKFKVYPPFSGTEEYNFPDPVGPVLLCHHHHEEAPTLARFIGKGIKYVDFKFPVDLLAGAFIKMGFASYEPIDVKGVKVAPIDVLMKLVRQPVDTFFTETEATAKLPPESAFSIVVEVKGAKSGKDVKYTLSLAPETTEANLGSYRRFGTTSIFVAIPTIVAAKICIEGDADRGIIAPECLDPIKFLKRMADMGAPIKFHEMCSKEVAIS
jgi:saccharopine dehydrogenase-like NADP-dependent oxidoreductase